jgi:hypothetical protein
LFLGEAGADVLRIVFDGWGEAIWSLVKALERERESIRIAAERSEGPFSPLSLLLARRLRHLAVELDFLDEYRTAHAQWLVGAQRAGSGSVRRDPDRISMRELRARSGATSGVPPRGRDEHPGRTAHGREPAIR